MKKLLMFALFGFSLFTYAQSTSKVESSSTGATYINIKDKNGDSETLISPTPGVYISSKKIIKQFKDDIDLANNPQKSALLPSEKNTTIIQDGKTAQELIKEEQELLKKLKITQDEVNSNLNNLSADSTIILSNTANRPLSNVSKKIEDKELPLSNFNNDTLNRVTKNGEEETLRRYLDFIKN